MILEQTLDKLRAMKLSMMAKAIEERLARPDHQELSIADFIGLVVDDEFLHREQTRLKARLSTAKFKERQACMEAIDYKIARGLTKPAMLELGQLRFIEKKQNVAFTGPAGAGKSYLAQALGHQACRQGYKVIYLRLPKLLTALAQARADGSYAKLLKRFEKGQLLILDDLGVSEITEKERRDLLEIFEDRYGVASTIVTSQLPIKDWHAYFGGGRAADSICDRLVHNCHRIELKRDTESQRKAQGAVDCKNLKCE
jgi:DNA replication protein DnaC